MAPITGMVEAVGQFPQPWGNDYPSLCELEEKAGRADPIFSPSILHEYQEVIRNQRNAISAHGASLILRYAPVWLKRLNLRQNIQHPKRGPSICIRT